MTTSTNASAADAAAAASYPFTSPDPFVLPGEFRELRAERPVAEVTVATGDTVWLVTRHEDVRAALTDRRLSRNIFRPDAARLIPGVPTRQMSSPFVEPPAHTRWRKLVTRAFTPRRVAQMRPRVQRIVDDLVDAIETQGPPADLVRSLAYPLSMGVLCEVLGIEAEEHGRFGGLADDALTINGLSMEEKAAAFGAMTTFSAELIAAKRERPGEDFLSTLIGLHDDDDGRLTEEELKATILAILTGGYESAVAQIGKSVLALLRHPGQLELLRADPGLVGGAVEESLRYAAMDSGFGSPRYALEDVTIGDVTIPKGSTVLVIRQSANRDEREFPDPDRFDITREPGQHFTFGFGPHLCLGQALARLELEIAIATLLRRLPGLAAAEPPERLPWDFRITAAGPRTLPITW